MDYNRKDPELQQGGVYAIRHIESGKFYVGSAYVFAKRWKEHVFHLASGKHHCRYLQNAYNKYGKNAFCFEIVEVCPTETCLEVEQKYLDSYRGDPHLYNISPNATGGCGPHSEETKAKMSILAQARSAETSKALTGRPVSEETRAKISESNSNPSEETLERMRKAKANVSEETRRLMSIGNTGKIRTEEVKEQISESLKDYHAEFREAGGVYPSGWTLSEETCAKMSVAKTGHEVTEETRAKISAKNKGSKRTEEVKGRMRVAANLRWAKIHAEKTAAAAKLFAKNQTN
jgi:group I intron endonuclease